MGMFGSIGKALGGAVPGLAGPTGPMPAAPASAPAAGPALAAPGMAAAPGLSKGIASFAKGEPTPGMGATGAVKPVNLAGGLGALGKRLPQIKSMRGGRR
jgi:hypothetical protein